MGGMIARRLFECYRDWAREAGVREVLTGVRLVSRGKPRIDFIPRWESSILAASIA